MAEHAIWGMPELHNYWADEQEIHLPECHCGNLVAVHFGARHMPPYCYCRGSGGVNCSFYETVHNCPELRIFMATEPANVFNIFAGYIDGVPRLRRARVVGDNDAALIRTLLVHFLAAARSRSPRGASLRLPLRIDHFWERLADALAWARLVHNHDDQGNARTVASIRRHCFDRFGQSQQWE